MEIWGKKICRPSTLYSKVICLKDIKMHTYTMTRMKSVYFVTEYAVSFSRRTLLHGVNFSHFVLYFLAT